MSQTRVPRFELQFDPSQIPELAARYASDEDTRVEQIGHEAKSRGYYTRPELLELCLWKTTRSKPLVARNTDGEVEEVTRLALSARSEALRIWIPMVLSGVSWATSSVLLHFAHNDQYPILDFRALEAFGVTVEPTFSTDFWNAYVAASRHLAAATGLDMRTVDRALWQWSKERTATE